MLSSSVYRRACLTAVAVALIAPPATAQTPTDDAGVLAMRQVLAGRVEFMIKAAPDRNDLGMKFTPEVAAMLDAMSCEQRQLYAERWPERGRS